MNKLANIALQDTDIVNYDLRKHVFDEDSIKEKLRACCLSFLILINSRKEVTTLDLKNLLRQLSPQHQWTQDFVSGCCMLVQQLCDDKITYTNRLAAAAPGQFYRGYYLVGGLHGTNLDINSIMVNLEKELNF